jgi:deoxycytidylate deaminase
VLQSGIKEFHYEESYKNENGIELLNKYSKVEIFKHKREVNYIEHIEREYYDDEAGYIG